MKLFGHLLFSGRNSKKSQAGNIFLMLFGAVGLVGVIGASTMTIMKGPVKTMSQVTKRTIAENNMIATGKLALIAAASSGTADCDGDGAIEPLPYGAAIAGFTGGGQLNPAISAATSDPWGTAYGYCVWDHGALIDDAACGGGVGMNAGNAAQTGYVLAVISAGPDRTFQTSCQDDPAMYVNKLASSDDLTMGYTYEEANALSGGLWNLKSGDPDIAEIQKDLEVKDASNNVQLAFDSATGDLTIGNAGTIPSIVTDYISLLTGTNAGIEFLDPIISSDDILTTADITAQDLVATATLTATGNITTTTGDLVATAGDVSAVDGVFSGTLTMDDLSVTDDAVIGDTLNVTGNSVLTGTLDVTGNTDLSTLSTTGTATLQDLDVTTDANITGLATVGSTLDVTGAATFDSTLTVEGNTTLGVGGGDTVTITGNTDIVGVLDMNSNLISNVTNPVAAQDAATKDYVDDQITATTGVNETDPTIVKPLGIAGKICASTGTQIECATDIVESDPEVGTLNNGQYCTSDGTQVNCTSTLPSVTTTARELADTDNDTKIQVEESADEDYIRFDTVGFERMVIEPTGDIGIGVSNPTNLLQIYDSSFVAYTPTIEAVSEGESSLLLRSASNTANYNPEFWGIRSRGTVTAPTIIQDEDFGLSLRSFVYDGTDYFNEIGAISFIVDETPGSDDVPGRIEFHTQPDGSAGSIDGTTPELVIRNTGRIGIGLADPDTLLEIAGTAKVADGGESCTVAGDGGMIRYSGTSLQYCNGTAWQTIIDTSSSADAIDDLTDAETDYVTDFNLFMGSNAGAGVAAGAQYNIAIGQNSLDAVLTNAADNNIAIGYNALTTNTSGRANIAVGIGSMLSNTTGEYNTAVGQWPLYSNTTGNNNLALGNGALYTNVANHESTALGFGAMYYANDTAAGAVTYNTAVGAYALRGSGTAGSNTGTRNTALGHGSLFDNTSGTSNTVVGVSASENNTTGIENVALGDSALYTNQTGGYNTALGTWSLFNATGGYNTGVGKSALNLVDTGEYNTALGQNAGANITSGSRNIIIGAGINAMSAIADEQLNIGDLLYGDLGVTSGDPRIGAAKYCDENLANCFLATDVSGSSVAIDDLTDAETDYATDFNLFMGSNAGAGVVAAASHNLAIGQNALDAALTNNADGNVAVGYNVLSANTSGDTNTAVGAHSLESNTTGAGNTALGYYTLSANIDGENNMAIGTATLQVNSSGDSNVGIGRASMANSETGSNNVAIGHHSLYNNVAGDESVAVGQQAMEYANDSGTIFTTYNTAVGAYALQGSSTPSNNTGTNNTMVGHSAGISMTSGSYNTAVGRDALRGVTTDSHNTAIGNNASVYAGGTANTSLGSNTLSSTWMGSLASGASNVAIGHSSMTKSTLSDYTVALGTRSLTELTTGDNNIAIGYQAGDNITTGGTNIIIGHDINAMAAAGSSQLNIGDTLFGDLSNDRLRIGGSGAISAFNDLEIAGTMATKISTGTTAERPGTPANGMIRYNTTSGKFEGYQAGAWTDIVGASGASTIDDLTDAETDYATDFNLFMGSNAGANVAAGAQYNIAIGQNSLDAVLTNAADENTAVGYNSLTANTSGTANTAHGSFALFANTGGQGNVGIGNGALYNNSTGLLNVAVGAEAMAGGGSAINNSVAIGYRALYEASGSDNTAVGQEALDAVSLGIGNISLGYKAGDNITTGSTNIIIGYQADAMAAAGSNQLNIGDTLFGDLSNDRLRIGGSGAISAFNDLEIAGTMATKISTGTTAQRPGTPANGMIRYNTTSGKFEGYQAGAWTDMIGGGGGGGAIDDLTDAETDYATDFNLFMGSNAGAGIAAGAQYNLAIGQGAMDAVMTNAADENIAIGYNALTALTTGTTNVAVGATSISRNTTGTDNIGVGTDSGLGITSGSGNIAIGHRALDGNYGSNSITSDDNTAIGTEAMADGTPGQENVAIGRRALLNNDAAYNTAVGAQALVNSATGVHNVAIGYGALRLLDGPVANNNVALGGDAGGNITTGYDNIIIGHEIDAMSATGNNQLNIGDTLFGDLANDRLRIGGSGAISAFNDLEIAGTMATKISTGTTAQRPGTPANGMIRYNTTSGKFEGYQAGAWTNMIGGGGGGGAIDDLTDAETDYVTDFNMFMGSSAGASVAAGAQYNIAIGQTAMDAVMTNAADKNIAIGYDSLTALTSGDDNVAVGFEALKAVNTGRWNTAVGTGAGLFLTSGTDNSLIGWGAGTYLDTGGSNTALGYLALASSWGGSPASASHNVALGYRAYGKATTGLGNVAIGYDALFNNTVGGDNVAIGNSAGDNITTGNTNIIIGANVDAVSATGDNQLNIGNTIYGNMANDYIGIGNTAPSVALDVTGSIEYSGTITDVSDRRLKDDITALSERGSMLEKVTALDTYSFTMKDDAKKQVEFGVIAQEINAIFPELVKTDESTEEKYMSVNYVGLIAPMIEATKELKAENTALKTELATLQKNQEEILQSLDAIGAKVGYFSTERTKPSLSSVGIGLGGLMMGIGLMVLYRRQKKSA